MMQCNSPPIKDGCHSWRLFSIYRLYILARYQEGFWLEYTCLNFKLSRFVSDLGVSKIKMKLLSRMTRGTRNCSKLAIDREKLQQEGKKIIFSRPRSPKGVFVVNMQSHIRTLSHIYLWLL